MILALASVACRAGEEQSIDRQARKIIAKKCTGCHNDARIKAAFSAGKDMRVTRRRCRARGLSGNEQEVLGNYRKHSPQLK